MNIDYLMESDDETLRLEMKTDPSIVENQALWAGIKPGMRVADIGCGPGVTTSVLHKLNQPFGETIGFDFSENRLNYAEKNYSQDKLQFVLKDVREPIENVGLFDFVWVRFLLEYYLKNSFEIVQNLTNILKPGGILCLIDLDNNMLNHFEIPWRLEKTIKSIAAELSQKANFDPFAGRKLYSFLFDLGFKDIQVNIRGHHIIYGDLKDSDSFNFMKKIEITPKKIGYKFDEYEGGYEDFLEECNNFFSSPRRFTYSPIISCVGKKPK
jgi:ubiquinone/menaquinone biosynthesis C-methylase UbiE